MTRIGGLYVVTSQDLLTKNSGLNLQQAIQAVIAGGANWLQVREPLIPLKDLLEVCVFGLAVAREKGVGFLINDRVDLMLAVDADGVHLGWRSLPVKEARKLVGRQKIIGVSCHSERDCLAAAEAGADYVTLGPVYSTPSKYGIVEPIGPSVLKAATAKLKIPVIALGGITLPTVPEVLACGVAGIAIVSGIMGAVNVKTATADFASALT